MLIPWIYNVQHRPLGLHVHLELTLVSLSVLLYSQSINHLFSHFIVSWSLMQSFILVVHSFIHSFSYLFITLISRAFIHAVIHSFIHAFIKLFINLFIHSVINPFSYSSINQSIFLFIHLILHAFICLSCENIHSYISLLHVFHSFPHTVNHPSIHIFSIVTQTIHQCSFYSYLP